MRLKAPAEYRLLGKRISNASAEGIATGKPIFGIDAKVDRHGLRELRQVSVRLAASQNRQMSRLSKRCQVLSTLSFLEGTPGPISFDIRNSNAIQSGVAIVGKDTWSTFKAREKLEVDWDLSAASQDDSDAIEIEALAALAAGKVQAEIERAGDVEAAFANAAMTADATYSSDFVSHAQLEPQGVLVSAATSAVKCGPAVKLQSSSRQT